MAHSLYGFNTLQSIVSSDQPGTKSNKRKSKDNSSAKIKKETASSKRGKSDGNENHTKNHSILSFFTKGSSPSVTAAICTSSNTNSDSITRNPKFMASRRETLVELDKENDHRLLNTTTVIGSTSNEPANSPITCSVAQTPTILLPSPATPATPVTPKSTITANIGGEYELQEDNKRTIEGATDMFEEQMEWDTSSQPSYYLRNFIIVIESVMSKNLHLFLPDEVKLVEQFMLLPEPSQRIFIRMFQRKGPWFAVNKLDYKEILDVQQAIDILHDFNYTEYHNLDTDGIACISYLLSVEQLREVLLTSKKPVAGRLSSMNREQLLQALLNKEDKQLSLFAILKASDNQTGVSKHERLVVDLLGTCVKISHKAREIFKRINTLFFMNQQDSASQVMLLVDFQKIRFPVYVVWGDSSPNYAVTKRRTASSSYVPDSEINDRISSLTTDNDSITDGELLDHAIFASQNSHSLFPTREALLAYETATVFANSMYTAISETKTDEALDMLQIASGYLSQHPSTSTELCSIRPNYDFSVRFSAAWVYCSIVTVGISLLESQKRYSEANELLRQQLTRSEATGRRGDWWNRLAVNLSHLNKKRESLEVCEEALQDPLVRAGDRLKLEKRLLRLCKPPTRWKVPTHLLSLTTVIKEPKKVLIRGKLMETGMSGKKSVFKGYDGNPCGVETFSKQFYSLNDNWEGVHDEGRTLLAIFVLLLWQPIFDSSVPHVFQTPYQPAPLDFGLETFYGARKDRIDHVLEFITRDGAEKILEENWNANYGCQVKCVDWKQLRLEELKMILRCAGGETISKLCWFLAQDLKSLDSGWPDLLLWRSRAAGSHIKMVEVKGPRDRLSDQQRITIDLLQNCGIDVEICHVTEGEIKGSKFDDGSLYYLLSG